MVFLSFTSSQVVHVNVTTYAIATRPGTRPYLPRAEVAIYPPNRSYFWIKTLCGKVSVLVITMVVVKLSGLYMCGWILIPKWDWLYTHLIGDFFRD